MSNTPFEEFRVVCTNLKAYGVPLSVFVCYQSVIQENAFGYFVRQKVYTDVLKRATANVASPSFYYIPGNFILYFISEINSVCHFIFHKSLYRFVRCQSQIVIQLGSCLIAFFSTLPKQPFIVSKVGGTFHL